ncbi:MAG: DUF3135 domain-containing protein [Pseudomonadota bacterium]
MDFNFDSLSKLAREDSEAFERKAQALVEQLITSAPPARQKRLRGLQFRINMERQRSTSPLGACVRINAMMWESVGELRTALHDLANYAKKPLPEKPQVAAKVLPFSRSCLIE